MRKAVHELDRVRAFVETLKGREVLMRICRGRKRVVRQSGILTDTYPSVFTIRLTPAQNAALVTYSYNDVLCGEVEICIVQPEEAL
jgi:uncharacterized protein Veg